ncbi:MAG: aminomethyltransferase family protein [Gaiellales bacterium]
MHSSYALETSDFSVERDGKSAPLSELWPGGFTHEDRLGVLLANPMDAVGCSNLISGTITLFYDNLKQTQGTGNFFRYSDAYLFGVGCEPGDFNQLDVWPLHKFVTILQPSTEAVLEALIDRRITVLAIPETGARCRGEVVLSTWNCFLDIVRCVVTYSPRTGQARDADVSLVGNRVVESYVEQAIFTTPGVDHGEQARLRRLRRNLDREEKQPVESYRTLSTPMAARSLLGVTQVLPPGHQELTRRATPTTIMPVEVAMPPLDADSAPFDTAAAAALQVDGPAPAGVYPDGLRRTAFDAIQRRMGGEFAEFEDWSWISDFGDPVSEHNTVRHAVGIWDESPLQKWLFTGKDALAAADHLFTSDMASLDVGQARYGPFVDANGKMLGDGVVYNTGDSKRGILVVTALESDAAHFRRTLGDRFDVEIEQVTERMPHLQVQGPRSRELLELLTDADVAGLKYFRFTAEPVTVAGVGGCLVSRTGYSGELGYEVFCPPEGAEQLWQALLDSGASMGIRPYGLAAVESLRIESGLIFLGYDYFPGVTSPFHMSLDRMIKLDKGDFHGKQALEAEADAGITHRMVTLVVAGEEAPDYGAPVYSNGRGVGKLTSPSAGRSPTVDKVIGMASIETELTEPGTQVEVAMPDGRLVPAIVDVYPIFDPQKERPRS